DQIAIHVGYDIENLSDPERNRKYHGERAVDHYGRSVPKPAQGSENLSGFTASTQKILQAVEKLFDRIVDPGLLVRRMNVIATHVVEEVRAAQKEEEYEQLDFFSLQKEKIGSREEEIERRKKERRLQEAEIAIRNKYGKNAILKGMNFLEGATARERNKQIGGHKA
ncbi:MAG: DNA methylase, partial [Lachnospiraceae bacterium]|nr:DNA methylase [Lachnospiraceae bacterium]